ncbi:hypothetical protein [Psychrosphaera algicola]|uniref:Uncharacterized protein n=2 Tax=Psychrosphaera TaxID=907197 RepID=A0ABT5FID1_9GAMM|nr:hypothetical protein [Psychrosphaera sp. G1-22]MDC2890949.1 hypothetical protein [Psychrosphaera sp. G1-22]
MAKFDERVEALLAKHPSLSKDEAIKIVTDKNERKKSRREERNNRKNAEIVAETTVESEVEGDVDGDVETTE